jgi:hypothetical protein
MSELFPLTPGVKPLPLVATCQWRAFPAHRPADEEINTVLCVSTPFAKIKHQTAVYDGLEWWNHDRTDLFTDTVTFWCVPPASPEHMAENAAHGAEVAA